MARLILGKLFQDENLKKSTTDMFMVYSLIKQYCFLLRTLYIHAELEPPPEFKVTSISLQKRETLNWYLGGLGKIDVGLCVAYDESSFLGGCYMCYQGPRVSEDNVVTLREGFKQFTVIIKSLNGKSI